MLVCFFRMVFSFEWCTISLDVVVLAMVVGCVGDWTVCMIATLLFADSSASCHKTFIHTHTRTTHDTLSLESSDGMRLNWKQARGATGWGRATNDTSALELNSRCPGVELSSRPSQVCHFVLSSHSHTHAHIHTHTHTTHEHIHTRIYTNINT